MQEGWTVTRRERPSPQGAIRPRTCRSSPVRPISDWAATAPGATTRRGSMSSVSFKSRSLQASISPASGS